MPQTLGSSTILARAFTTGRTALLHEVQPSLYDDLILARRFRSQFTKSLKSVASLSIRLKPITTALSDKCLTRSIYQHVGSHKGMKYLHWNMRDINYGFAALEHRQRVLKGIPVIIEDDKKIDLARLLIDIYGVGYIGHPRLESLLVRNSIKPRDFLTGPQEAEAFEKRNFVGLHQSTLRKVDVIANLADRAHSRQLKTNTTCWQMHGGRVRTALNWMAESRTFQLVAGLASIVGLALAIWAIVATRGKI
jgi:hypothetical protein